MNESPVARSFSDNLQPATAPAGAAHASLVLRHAGGALVAPLSAARSITVGRRLPADVIIDDRSLALQHARFSLMGEGLSVEDLGSRSGTWVAGRPVRSAQLASGQSVRLGNVTATVHVAAPSPCDSSSDRHPDALVAGESMRPFHDLLRHVAATPLAVLFAGEPGVGKRLAARLLHGESGCDGALVQVQCAQQSPFAPEAHDGRSLLERAQGGSLLLRDVGSLSPADQAALLALLRTGRPAANAPRVAVRVIALETRELGELVLGGLFRPDLHRQLAALTLRLPPLRERRDEIALLVSRFLAQVARTWGRPPRGISDAALTRLQELPWPGNVAQLKAAIEHADLVCVGQRIEVEDFPRELMQAPALAAGAWPVSQTPAGVLPPSETEAGRAGLDFKGRVREYETRMIIDALKRSGGNQRATARLLRIPLRTLAHKMKAFGIKQRLAHEVARDSGVLT